MPTASGLEGLLECAHRWDVEVVDAYRLWYGSVDPCPLDCSALIRVGSAICHQLGHHRLLICGELRDGRVDVCRCRSCRCSCDLTLVRHRSQLREDSCNVVVNVVVRFFGKRVKRILDVSMLARRVACRVEATLECRLNERLQLEVSFVDFRASVPFLEVAYV